jgi:tetratricopeptide (TPR) repeat protein
MKYIIIIIPILFLLSCNKYLDKAGDPTKKIPHTVADVQMLLDKPLNTGCTFIGADEYFVPAKRYGNLRTIDKNYYLTWVLNSEISHINPALWSTPYQAIFNANLSIEILKETGFTTENKKEWDHAMGSAYFNRAWCLLTVAWEFCNTWHEERSRTDPGAVIDLDSDVHQTLSRSTVAETYTQIIKDAEEALKHLPVYPTHPVRPSKLATYGLLARTYLSMRKYDEALQQCDLYLRELNTLIDYNDPAEAPQAPDAFFELFNSEVIYQNNPVTTGTTIHYLLNNIDSVLYASFHEKDLRKKVFFKPYEGHQQFKGSYTGGSGHMTGICTDELYLTRAECYARKGEVEKAMKDLNDLLVKRWTAADFVPVTAATKEEALAIILQERKKELIFRGVRWMDIKRLNEEGANISIIRKSPDGSESGILPPKSPRFAMQLPLDIVLTFGYKQNPIE